MGTSIIVWIILVIIPLFPVISLYRLFENQSYFELNGAVRGLVASGPIAAYAFFVYVGWQIFAKVSQQRKTEQRLRDCEIQLGSAEQLVQVLKTQNNDLSEQLLSVAPSRELADELEGVWDFTSRSGVHQRVLTGETTVRLTSGALRLRGNFKENGNLIGEWTSEAAQIIDGSDLLIVYKMTEFDNQNIKQLRGVCTFQLSSPPVIAMTGFWTVVGWTEMYGTVEYKKRLV